jgi:hypothetical protein
MMVDGSASVNIMT